MPRSPTYFHFSPPKSLSLIYLFFPTPLLHATVFVPDHPRSPTNAPLPLPRPRHRALVSIFPCNTSRFCCKMARSARGRHRLSSHMRSTPYPLPSYRQGIQEKDGKPKRTSKAIKKDWEDATCSVCMEFPHNAVLLLCSSHDKGCRPYMCGTSYRYSNCLDQFKKAYMKAENQSGSLGNPNWSLTEKSEVTELACPLCRGQVKGWTVVEPAREYLNAKKRSCTQDNCSFAGTYKELRKHVRAEHPTAKPRQVDPLLEQKWRRLEHERDHEDVISTIRTSMPGAMVLGDYVIENSGAYDSDEEEGLDVEDGYGGRGRVDENWFNFLFLLQAFGNSGNANFASRLRRAQRGYRVLDGEGGGGGRAPSPSASTTDFSHLTPASEGDDIEEDDDSGALVIRQGRGVGTQRTGRRRRRRRSRSRSGIGFT